MRQLERLLRYLKSIPDDRPEDFYIDIPNEDIVFDDNSDEQPDDQDPASGQSETIEKPVDEIVDKQIKDTASYSYHKRKYSDYKPAIQGFTVTVEDFDTELIAQIPDFRRTHFNIIREEIEKFGTNVDSEQIEGFVLFVPMDIRGESLYLTQLEFSFNEPVVEIKYVLKKEESHLYNGEPFYPRLTDNEYDKKDLPSNLREKIQARYNKILDLEAEIPRDRTKWILYKYFNAFMINAKELAKKEEISQDTIQNHHGLIRRYVESLFSIPLKGGAPDAGHYLKEMGGYVGDDYEWNHEN